VNARAALLLALATSACAVDEASEVDAYRSVLDAGMPAEVVAPRTGDKLDAKLAMQLANAHNESLAIEGEQYLRALIDRRRAAAAFLPVVSLSPSYFLRDAGSGTSDGFDVPISATEFVNPVSDSAEVDRTEYAIDVRRALLYEAQDGLMLDVARTLFEVLRSERSAAVLQSSLAVQEARVDDVRARRDVGFARPLDVSLSESSAADARVSLLIAQRNARTGRATLEFLTGVPLPDIALDGTLDVPDEVPTTDELIARARQQRQDVAAAAAAVDTAASRVRVSKGRWYPSLALNLDVFLSRDSLPTDQDWTSLLQVNLPLFTGGRIQADVRESLSLLREAKLTYAQSLRAVQRDIEIAVLNLRESRERVAELRVQLATARDGSDQAEGLYDAGLATNLERLAAQTDQLRTELELENAVFDRQVSYLDLLRASGLLYEWVGFQRAPPHTGAEGEHAEAR
jgi:outer membrane protein TolC